MFKFDTKHTEGTWVNANKHVTYQAAMWLKYLKLIVKIYLVYHFNSSE